MGPLFAAACFSSCFSGGGKVDPGRDDTPDGGSSDASMMMPRDASAHEPDLHSATDQGSPSDLAGPVDLARLVDLASPADLAIPMDLASPPPDLTSPPDLTMSPDLAFPMNQDVQIYVDNFCNMNVVPKVFNVPRGASLKLTYYNRSVDYPVDVWLSYGGGFLDLATGANWPDRFEHCRNPRPYSSYADISTACSNFRLMINCL